MTAAAVRTIEGAGHGLPLIHRDTVVSLLREATS